MIPISLSIQGLYSYQSEKQQIDFTKLTSAQVFGIFGATGSGKSSILEAISFALYGESERLNRQDRRSYNMMNLKSDVLDIDFVFEVEADRYRFTVSGKRNSKQFDKVGTLDRNAYKWETDTWQPIEVGSTAEIIGLSYENFKRTIIIPQGKFQEFLQLTETDRTRMLREIFNLGKYELYRKTATLDTKNGLAMARQESLLSQLETVNSIAVETAVAQLQSAESEYAELSLKLEQKTNALKKLEVLKERFLRLEQQRKEIETLSLQADEFDKRAIHLAEYETCLIDFKPLIDRQVEVVSQSNKTQSSLKAKREALTHASQELGKFEDTFQSVQQEYANREEILRKAEELERIISLKEVQQNIVAIQKRIQDGGTFITDGQQRIADLKTDSRTYKDEIKQIRDQLPDLADLLAIRDWFGRQTSLKAESQRAQQSQELARKELENWNIEKAAILKTSTLNVAQHSLPIPKLIGIIQQEIQQAKTSKTKAADQVQTLASAMHMADYADQLAAGEPCPLCGSVHHPDPAIPENLSFQLTEAQKEAETQEQNLQQWQRVAIQLESLEQQSQSLIKHLKDQSQESDRIQGLIDQHQTQFVWEAFRDKNEEAVSQRIAEIKEQNLKIEQLNLKSEAAESQLVTEEKKLETYNRALEKLQTDRQQFEVSLEGGKQGLKQIEFQTWQALANVKIEKAAVDERKRYKDLKDLYQTCEERIRQLRSNSDVLRGEIAGLEQQEQDSTRQLVRINQQLNEQLEKSDFSDMQTVKRILDRELNIESEKKAISRFREQVNAAKTNLRELEAQVAGKEQELTTFESLQTEITELKVKGNELSQQIGGLRQEWERLERELGRKREITQELERLQLRNEDLRTLKNMFSRSGFVNYVSTIYLHNLCLAANERFRKLTRGVLSMEATENNSFQIRDFLNNGQTRSVKTLSGGQTFQASLSLALALADQVQQQAKSSQNFFFIDEGFGSQDRESLQTIFQTLKSLRHENRIVGVISHVEELQEEIDTYLKINNDSERGSIVSSSWE